jgi:hypothetical protein
VEDDGRKQGGKRIVTRAPEFQKVNSFWFNLRHVTIASHSTSVESKIKKIIIIINIENYNAMSLDAN